MDTWKPGDTVVLRYFKRGRLGSAMPTTAIGDMTLWLAPRTRGRWGAVNGRHVRAVTLEERFTGEWGSVEHTWQGAGVIIVGRPGRAHSIWHFFDEGRFSGWYVQLEAPWRASSIGFDTEDHDLDLWVEPDGSWRWKDEDELDAAVEFGLYTPEQAAAFRAEGERVLAEWPFPTGWEDWRPDPARPLPVLPSGWDEL